MLRKPVSLFLSLLVSALILSSSGLAGAASTKVADPGAGDGTIEIGSTYSFGQTTPGASVSRTFQLVNEDESRFMRIYGVWIKQDDGHPEWVITKKPKDWILPGESAELTIEFVATKPGVHKAGISWYVEMKPVSKEEDKDNFFTFNVSGEALESQPSPGQD